MPVLPRRFLILLLSLAAPAGLARDRESVYALWPGEPQLRLQSHQASTEADKDRLGMRMDLGWPGLGKARLMLDTESEASGAPRFKRFGFEQKLPLSQYALLPAKLDLDLSVDRHSGEAWNYRLKPRLQSHIGELELKASLSVAGDAASLSAVPGLRYRVSSDYALSPRFSLGLAGEGEQRWGAGEPAGLTLTPRLGGRVGLGAGASLRYGIGLGLDLERRESHPDLQLKLEIPLR